MHPNKRLNTSPNILKTGMFKWPTYIYHTYPVGSDFWENPQKILSLFILHAYIHILLVLSLWRPLIDTESLEFNL